MGSKYTTRQVVSRIADIASRTASKANPIKTGTVVGRNPDGSLVVSDGRGGCLRQAPKANVRVGQTITLGLEPALGQQTNLPLATFTLQPTTVPCPGDDRRCDQIPGGPGCFVEGSVGILFVAGSSQMISYSKSAGSGLAWSDRLIPAPSTLFYSTSTNRTLLNEADSITDDSSLDQVQCSRIFLRFDLSAVPSDATITEAKLRLALSGNASLTLRTDTAASVMVALSTALGVDKYADWPLFGASAIGTATIQDIIDAGPSPHASSPYTYDIPLTVSGLTVSDLSKLALLLSDDFNSTAFPFAGDLVNNYVVSDWTNANAFELLLTYAVGSEFF